jgi:hypothetical protein
MKKRIFEFLGLIFRPATIGDITHLMSLQIHFNKINVLKNKWGKGFLSLLSEEDQLHKCILDQNIEVVHRAGKPSELLGFGFFMSEATASESVFMQPFVDLILKIRDDNGNGNTLLQLSEHGGNFMILAQLFVVPELSGKGIEKELFNRVAATFGKNIKYIVTGLSADNHAGIKLLKENGFISHATYHAQNDESFMVLIKKMRR